MIELTLPSPPSANRYWRSLVIRGQSRVVLSSAAKAFRAEVAAIAAAAGIRTPLAGRVAVDVTLYPARPQDAARRMKRDPLAWDDTVRSIDLDNALKVLIDAIKGTVIEDDRWVWEIRARRAEPDGEARTVLRVEPIRVAVVQASLLEAA
jgi:crossover junction endodeoxyribonuclease RusA